MRYLSVCSGIEAASVAWHHLGWEPVGFSEIEPFPAAVLKHRFPHVPNYGDMTKFEEWPIEPGTVDLLVGGTPCQSFSVAGLRKGLEDPRGNLMLTYLAIAARFKPRWVVWENVPGVLSSNGGRDFGTFLGALGELGYAWAYRVLDAQYVRVGRWPRAVPQRRRRVFVVGRLIERDFRDWAAAAQAVLIPEGVRRHLEASGKARKGAPSDAEGGARGGCWWDGSDCAGTLTKQNANGAQRMPDKDNLGAVLTAGYRWQNDEIGLVDDGTISGLRASAGTSGFHEMNHPVVVQEAVAFQSCVDRSNPSVSVSDAAFCLPANAMSDRGQAVAFAQNQREEVREIDVPGALAAEPGTHQQTFIAQPVPFRKAKRAQSATDDESWVQAQQANTLNGFDTGERDTHAVAVSDSLVAKNNQCTGIQTEVVAHSLRAEGFDASEDGTGRGTPLVPSTPMTVRRLSCRECERLQGFPDDWTLIPWRGKPAEQCPDGPRYKALGNSMACNCMAWIGEKIQAWESAHA